MFPNLPKTWMKVFSWPKFEKAVAITTWFQFSQGQFLFHCQGQKEWQNSLRLFCRFGHYFALVGKIDTTPLTCECSCILCPNVENLARIMANFSALGMRPHPHAVRLWSELSSILIRERSDPRNKPCGTLQFVEVGKCSLFEEFA